MGVVLLVGTGCGRMPDVSGEWSVPVDAERVPLAHARTFEVFERDGYRILDIGARIVSWGAAADAPEVRARIVLLPRDSVAPPLEGDLSGATVVRVPAERIALNYDYLEAMVEALGALDRVVAVGGVKSWNDDLRARTRAGQIAQIGYGWHLPPELDALLDARPDLLLMGLGDLEHAQHYDRIRSLGIPVVPVFANNEVHPLGRVEYVRLFGMLLGEEVLAAAFVEDVVTRFESLERLAHAQPPRSAMLAWFLGGDRWMVAVRNFYAGLLRAANLSNPFEGEDDAGASHYARIGTEALIDRGRDADCWIIRDPISTPFTSEKTLAHFRAYRDGCVFALDGRTKPEADAYDWYFFGVIRPDWILNDLVRMAYPELETEPFHYLRPESSGK